MARRDIPECGRERPSGRSYAGRGRNGKGRAARRGRARPSGRVHLTSTAASILLSATTGAGDAPIDIERSSFGHVQRPIRTAVRTWGERPITRHSDDLICGVDPRSHIRDTESSKRQTTCVQWTISLESQLARRSANTARSSRNGAAPASRTSSAPRRAPVLVGFAGHRPDGDDVGDDEDERDDHRGLEQDGARPCRCAVGRCRRRRVRARAGRAVRPSRRRGGRS